MVLIVVGRLYILPGPSALKKIVLEKKTLFYYVVRPIVSTKILEYYSTIGEEEN